MNECSRSDGVTIRIAGEVDDVPQFIRGRLGRTDTSARFRVELDDTAYETPNARLDALAVFSAASLRRHGADLAAGGTLILDSAGFTPSALQAAGYERDPRDALRRAGLRLLTINMSALASGFAGAAPTRTAPQGSLRMYWALGLMLALHGHTTAASEAWIVTCSAGDTTQARNALRDGHAFAQTARIPPTWQTWSSERDPFSAGTWRKVTGSQALAFGLSAGAQDLGLDPFFSAPPTDHAGALLDAMRDLGPSAGVRCVETESAAAAMSAALGASFAGAIGIAATAGRDTALAAATLGLAVSAELPLIAIAIQRPGPAAGLPPGTAQADLSWAINGRTGDAPCPVIALRSPAHAFAVAREAVRLSVAHMTPVILLCDAHAMVSAEAFRIPFLPPASPRTPAQTLTHDFQPFARDTRTLARPWAVPGTAGGAHRTGGLEQRDGSGAISGDPGNHARMTMLRERKLALIVEREPEVDLASGTPGGEILLVGWGSSFTAIAEAAAGLRAGGIHAAHLHLDLVIPLPRGLTALVASFRHVLVPEMNAGQLVHLLRATSLVNARPLSRVNGQPLSGYEIEAAVWSLLKGDAA
ncbi:2-oxoacid:acceptor oxidoreductase family protein [Stappia sp. ES.058]|uniref:2-oxoacid:acceptor oxidoreductase family protein n=1 Tax=Stappia sp. ES.058 TaxID=1881061 RepID=UPI00087B681C|nr:2-oxoacid:acceptor oxidoreductase family protein [Stappia sp. ES.058]SDU36700.1 2-oxoglutarate ferredoxin oxidoreductase subunit alpha [Stappia sp. ES.058]